ncbi:unnamed protein product [Protopolystoma xenopodis]|uniref:Uncharacterized protein n=1 Tax=Protopolystoma xenopodis TaxID=117903 RepID=A0A3S5B3Q5_9PLAT|nr:unnamed protein product [Protopolystoma xenopodis]
MVISYNQIKGPGLCAIADAMANHNQTLKRIFLWGNDFEESACDAFARLLSSGRLEEQNTDFQPYGVDGRTYFAKLHNDCDYRRYRFTVPYWKKQAPQDRSIALS